METEFLNTGDYLAEFSVMELRRNAWRHHHICVPFASLIPFHQIDAL